MDYLANRSQWTQIDGASSESKPVKIGVPLGSLLEPGLFITYVNDLPDSIKVAKFIPLVKLLKRLLQPSR